MPIPEAPAAAGPYSTDGVTTSFPFAYKSFGVGYHAVVKETSGVQTQLVYGVDFAVTQNADQESNPGGNVIISPALPVGSSLTIYSNVPYDQPFDPSTAGGAFRSAAIRDAFDRIVTLLKQSDLATGGGTLLPSDRSLRVPSGESINALPVAASRASKILLFDGSGNASVATLGDLALLLAGGSMTGDINMSGNDITNVGALEVDGLTSLNGNAQVAEDKKLDIYLKDNGSNYGLTLRGSTLAFGHNLLALRFSGQAGEPSIYNHTIAITQTNDAAIDSFPKYRYDFAVAQYLGFNGNAYTLNSMTGQVGFAVAIFNPSDERLKSDWRDLPAGLVEGLAGVKVGTFLHSPGGVEQRSVGVSAQSLQQVLPEAVTEDENGVLGVTYANAALASCVALAKRVVALEARLAELEAR